MLHEKEYTRPRKFLLAAHGSNLAEFEAAVEANGIEADSFLEVQETEGAEAPVGTKVMWPAAWSNKLAGTAERLGKGSFGTVWGVKTTCPESRGVYVAVKALKATKAQASEEMEFLKAFSGSPYFLSFFDFQSVNTASQGTLYMLMMEAANKATPDFDAFLRRYTSPEHELERIIIIRDIAEGIAQMAGAQAVHRDLKPGNVMISYHCTDGICRGKVGDLGGACRLGKFTSKAGSEKLPHCTTGDVFGTPLYMAPEAYGGDIRGRNDVWAIGLMLYQAVFGYYVRHGQQLRAVLPWAIEAAASTGSKKELARAIIDLDIRQDRQWLPAIESHPLRDVLLGCLHHRVDERFTARDVATLLNRYLESLGVNSSPGEVAAGPACIVSPAAPTVRVPVSAQVASGKVAPPARTGATPAKNAAAAGGGAAKVEVPMKALGEELDAMDSEEDDEDTSVFDQSSDIDQYQLFRAIATGASTKFPVPSFFFKGYKGHPLVDEEGNVLPRDYITTWPQSKTDDMKRQLQGAKFVPGDRIMAVNRIPWTELTDRDKDQMVQGLKYKELDFRYRKAVNL